jgi:hypothetical protein
MMRRFAVVCLSALFAAGGALAQKEEIKDAGRSAKEAGRNAGEAAKETGKAAAKTTRKAARKAKKGAKRGVNAAADKTEDTAGAVKDKTRDNDRKP